MSLEISPSLRPRPPVASAQVEALAKIADSSPDFIGLIDQNGFFEYINAAGRQMAGIADDGPVSEIAALDIVGDNDRYRFSTEMMAEAMVSGKWAGAAVLRHLTTNRSIPAELMVFTIHSETDGPRHYGLIARDQRENKRIESALIQSEKLAAMGRLAGVVAHEINNPLQSIIELVYLLQTSRPEQYDRDARRHFQILDQELSRLASIVRGTLSFCRESGKTELIGLGPILDEVLYLCQGKLKPLNIEVVKRYSTRDRVLNFPGEMRQVFLNLVNNAVDAMPEGGRLRIFLRASRDRGNSRRRGLRVSICDTGAGIQPSEYGRIFEPFFTTKGAKGTGLGLWATRTILERHDGTIRFRSVRWRGRMMTCFSVFLPTEPSFSRKIPVQAEIAKAKHTDVRLNLNRASFEFLLVESELGNTFADRALVSADQVCIDRNLEQAQRAYDQVRRHRGRVQFPKDKLEFLNSKMGELKAKLDQLRMTKAS